MPTVGRTPGTLTLIGSGEMSPSMSKVHRAVMARIAGPVRAAFVDTPAGFELNSDQISERARAYFARQFEISLELVSFKAAASTTSAEVARALRQLGAANYIFAGPGSPTYAIHNWRNTVVWEAMARRLANGAHLALASAAAIAVGRYALPVYEIYKVGAPPRWVEGLDLLGPYGLELAIVPHWNNAEGGTFDTRHCFIGKPRWEVLEKELPDSTTVLGIDEYTACLLDLNGKKGRVIGAGQVTVRRGDREARFAAGATFEFDQLERQGERTALPEPVETLPKAAAYQLPPDWDMPPRQDDEVSVAPYIDLLVSVRAQLRAEEQWALADQIRDRLSELGVTLEDGPEETTWSRR